MYVESVRHTLGGTERVAFYTPPDARGYLCKIRKYRSPKFPRCFAMIYIYIFFFFLAIRKRRFSSESRIHHFLRSHGGTYGLPPYFSHSRLNSCSRTSAPRFRVNPVSSRLNSHICISSTPGKQREEFPSLSQHKKKKI